MYLAAAGVGRLGIVDFDEVDETNLQRQILYGSKDVGRKKLAAAEARLRSMNPHVQVVRHDLRLNRENALSVIGQYDITADGTDNFATRYLVNDACVLTGRPNVYASIYRFDGQVSVFGAPGGPCYRCLYPEPPPPGLVPSCAEGGVLGVLPGIVGSLQAAEVIKWICRIGKPLLGRLLLFDALEMTFRTLKVARDPACQVCGDNRSITELIDYDDFCGVPEVERAFTGRKFERIPRTISETISSRSGIPELTTFDLKERMDNDSNFLLLDVRAAPEFDMSNIGGTLIPLPELPDRLDEIAEYRDQEVVVICRSGARSGRAVAIMRDAGFEKAYNLRGGLLAWSEMIDSSIPRY